MSDVCAKEGEIGRQNVMSGIVRHVCHREREREEMKCGIVRHVCLEG